MFKRISKVTMLFIFLFIFCSLVEGEEFLKENRAATPTHWNVGKIAQIFKANTDRVDEVTIRIAAVFGNPDGKPIEVKICELDGNGFPDENQLIGDGKGIPKGEGECLITINCKKKLKIDSYYAVVLIQKDIDENGAGLNVWRPALTSKNPDWDEREIPLYFFKGQWTKTPTLTMYIRIIENKEATEKKKDAGDSQKQTSGFAFTDFFSAPSLDARWKKSESEPGKILVDNNRQLLRIGDAFSNHSYNIRTDLPANIRSISCDVNVLSDNSLSWAPGLIIYWNDQNYLRVLFSSFYQLTIESTRNRESSSEQKLGTIKAGQWSRCRLEIEDKYINVFFGPQEGEQLLVKKIDRIAEWTGDPKLIIGKGYQSKSYDFPLFNNNYEEKGVRASVLFDNIMIGSNENIAEELKKSVQLDKQMPEADLKKFIVGIWPNCVSKQEKFRNTIYLLSNFYQNLNFVYLNLNAESYIKAIKFVFEIPAAIGVDACLFGQWTDRVEINREEIVVDGQKYLRLSCSLKDFAVPGSFYGEDLWNRGEQYAWFNLPVSKSVPPLNLFVLPKAEKGNFKGSYRVYAGNKLVQEEKLDFIVLENKYKRDFDKVSDRFMGINFWGSEYLSGSLDKALFKKYIGVVEKTISAYKDLGVKYVIMDSGSDIETKKSFLEICKKNNIKVLSSQYNFRNWSYNSEGPSDLKLEPDEVCTNPAKGILNICPSLIMHGAGSYKQVLDIVKNWVAEVGSDGFVLDYENAPPLCFCNRCKEEFIKYTGIKDVNWPDEVKKGGRHYKKWIDFRCYQGAQYCRVIAEAVKEVNPKAFVTAWIVGYDYAGTLESAQIDVSKASKYIVPQIPHYTLAYEYKDIFEANRGNCSVEVAIKTIKNSISVIDKNVPVVYCGSIIYPFSSKTGWSDPDILNAEVSAIIGEGVKGLAFWGAQDNGAIDGRFAYYLKEWSEILFRGEKYFYEGKRDTGGLNLNIPENVKYYVYKLLDSALVVIVNFSDKDANIKFSLSGYNGKKKDLLNDVEYSSDVTIPSLGRKFIIFEK